MSSLGEAERRFSEALTRGEASAYRAALAPHGRVNRDGAPPAEGPAATIALVTARDRRVLRSTPEKIEVASSGDMGYARGRLELNADADAPPVHYVRVWRHDASGWRIVLDVDTHK